MNTFLFHHQHAFFSFREKKEIYRKVSPPIDMHNFGNYGNQDDFDSQSNEQIHQNLREKQQEEKRVRREAQDKLGAPNNFTNKDDFSKATTENIQTPKINAAKTRKIPPQTKEDLNSIIQNGVDLSGDFLNYVNTPSNRTMLTNMVSGLTNYHKGLNIPSSEIVRLVALKARDVQGERSLLNVFARGKGSTFKVTDVQGLYPALYNRLNIGNKANYYLASVLRMMQQLQKRYEKTTTETSRIEKEISPKITAANIAKVDRRKREKKTIIEQKNSAVQTSRIIEGLSDIYTENDSYYIYAGKTKIKLSLAHIKKLSEVSYLKMKKNRYLMIGEGDTKNDTNYFLVSEQEYARIQESKPWYARNKKIPREETQQQKATGDKFAQLLQSDIAGKNKELDGVQSPENFSIFNFLGLTGNEQKNAVETEHETLLSKDRISEKELYTTILNLRDTKNLTEAEMTEFLNRFKQNAKTKMNEVKSITNPHVQKILNTFWERYMENPLLGYANLLAQSEGSTKSFTRVLQDLYEKNNFSETSNVSKKTTTGLNNLAGQYLKTLKKNLPPAEYQALLKRGSGMYFSVGKSYEKKGNTPETEYLGSKTETIASRLEYGLWQNIGDKRTHESIKWGNNKKLVADNTEIIEREISRTLGPIIETGKNTVDLGSSTHYDTIGSGQDHISTDSRELDPTITNTGKAIITVTNTEITDTYQKYEIRVPVTTSRSRTDTSYQQTEVIHLTVTREGTRIYERNGVKTIVTEQDQTRTVTRVDTKKKTSYYRVYNKVKQNEVLFSGTIGVNALALQGGDDVSRLGVNANIGATYTNNSVYANKLEAFANATVSASTKATRDIDFFSSATFSKGGNLHKSATMNIKNLPGGTTLKASVDSLKNKKISLQKNITKDIYAQISASKSPYSKGFGVEIGARDRVYKNLAKKVLSQQKTNDLNALAEYVMNSKGTEFANLTKEQQNNIKATLAEVDLNKAFRGRIDSVGVNFSQTGIADFFNIFVNFVTSAEFLNTIRSREHLRTETEYVDGIIASGGMQQIPISSKEARQGFKLTDKLGRAYKTTNVRTEVYIEPKYKNIVKYTPKTQRVQYMPKKRSQKNPPLHVVNSIDANGNMIKEVYFADDIVEARYHSDTRYVSNYEKGSIGNTMEERDNAKKYAQIEKKSSFEQYSEKSIQKNYTAITQKLLTIRSQNRELFGRAWVLIQNSKNLNTREGVGKIMEQAAMKNIIKKLPDTLKKNISSQLLFAGINETIMQRSAVKRNVSLGNYKTSLRKKINYGNRVKQKMLTSLKIPEDEQSKFQFPSAESVRSTSDAQVYKNVVISMATVNHTFENVHLPRAKIHHGKVIQLNDGRRFVLGFFDRCNNASIVELKGNTQYTRSAKQVGRVLHLNTFGVGFSLQGFAPQYESKVVNTTDIFESRTQLKNECRTEIKEYKENVSRRETVQVVEELGTISRDGKTLTWTEQGEVQTVTIVGEPEKVYGEYIYKVRIEQGEPIIVPLPVPPPNISPPPPAKIPEVPPPKTPIDNGDTGTTTDFGNPPSAPTTPVRAPTIPPNNTGGDTTSWGNAPTHEDRLGILNGD